MSPLFTRAGLDAAVSIVAATVPPTPTYHWPLLSAEVGAQTWVKHENHTPTGAFKVRGGLVLMETMLMDTMRRRSDAPCGIVSATRGNHGQSLSLAGSRAGLEVTIVAPEGNNPDQNRAMEGFGGKVVVHGHDFDAAREYAAKLAAHEGLELVSPFHPELVRGVATYALELFSAVADLDAVYVPIGMGSGICGLITVRDLLGLRTRIVGVVAAGAPCYARSFAAGRPVSTERADTFVDGVATRNPDPVAVEIINAGADTVVEVPDSATVTAMQLLHRTTHNMPEPAGAIALAGLLARRDEHRGERVAVIMTGGNVDVDRYSAVLAGRVPGRPPAG